MRFHGGSRARARPQCEAAAQSVRGSRRPLAGVLSVTAVLTAHSERRPARLARQSNRRRSAHAHAHGQAPAAIRPRREPRVPGCNSHHRGRERQRRRRQVDRAVNLALALVRARHEGRLLDADIYGPSLPR